MQRIYANPGFSWRMHASTAVAVFAILFGFFELWSVLRAGPEEGGYGLLFAMLFIGGGAYAVWQMFTDYADVVVALDAHGSGRGLVTIWQPLAPKRIETGLDAFSSWRFKKVSGRGGVAEHMLLADHSGHKRPLKFHLGGKIVLTDAFRALAPEAVSAFETRSP